MRPLGGVGSVELDNEHAYLVGGYLTIMTRRGAAGNPAALVSWIQEHSQEMGWFGFDVSRIPTVKNELKDGVLRLQLTSFPFRLAGFLNGTADFGLENEVVTFHATATVHVQGVTDTQLEIARDAQGQITGRVEVPVSLANFSGRRDCTPSDIASSGRG